MVDSFLVATHTSAREASKALNDLLHYSPEDQDALLEVLDDYFTYPEDLEAIMMDTTGKTHQNNSTHTQHYIE